MAMSNHRVKLFMEQINQKEKTLVFCATQDHALAVRDLINQMKTSTDPNYCQRVTANDGELGNQHLRDFQDNEKSIPTILTTSQKLSTGVDARNIRNIILMRPIHSIIEFKQIIGRGTRLYDGKDYFTIYDFVRTYLHFADPEWDGEPMEPEPCAKCGSYPCECVKAPHSSAKKWSRCFSQDTYAEDPTSTTVPGFATSRHRRRSAALNPLIGWRTLCGIVGRRALEPSPANSLTKFAAAVAPTPIRKHVLGVEIRAVKLSSAKYWHRLEQNAFSSRMYFGRSFLLPSLLNHATR